jgi:hypothetical protein
MTILTGGGEISSGVPADASTTDTTAGGYDSAFCRGSVYVYSLGNGVGSYFESEHITETSEVFFHADWYQDAWFNPEDVVTFFDGAGLAVFRLRVSNSSMLCQAQYLASDGTTWTNIGSSFTTLLDTRNTIDIHMNAANPGTVSVYMSGTERSTGTADLSHIGGVAYYRIRSSLNSYWSQMLLSTESTIGHRLKTVPPTGAGATTDWTGTFNEIDEIPYNDADFVNSSTNGQVELFSHGTTIPSGYRVKAVIVAARAKRGSTGPSNLQLALQSGGTTYTSSSKALGLGYGAYTAVWENDPATAAPFTASAIETLQFGVKAIT